MSRPSSQIQGERIGLIGLGLMGTAMAERLLADGFRILGWDIDEARRVALREIGGGVASDPGMVGRECGRILVSLPTYDVVAQVLREIAGDLRPGRIILDTSTGEPEQAIELGRQLAGQEIAYLDATISGSSVQVRKQAVTAMVGGARAAFERCQDLLAAFGGKVLHVGPCGTGARLKLVTNLVLGLNRAAMAEGIVFARSLGIDLAQTLAVLQESMAYSRIMDTKGEKMIHGDFSTQGKLSQHLKDIDIILKAGAEVGQSLPLTEAHRQLLELAEAAGLGDLDNSAIIRAYDPQPARASSV